MTEMTRDEIYDRISEIGLAFSNDVNDGEDEDRDNQILYEGVSVVDVGNGPELRYGATLEDGTKVEARFRLNDLIHYSEEKPT